MRPSLIRNPRRYRLPRRARRRRNGKNRIINRRPPNISTKPQRYGPGRLLTNITLALPILGPETIHSINLGELLKSNIEFTELAGKFNFFKLIAIKVLLRTYQFNNTTKSGVFILNWHGEPPGDLMKSDNAKIFGPINMRNKVWKFIPPKMVIGTTNTDAAPLDLSEYINIHRFVLPAWFHLFHEFNGQNMPFMIEMVIETRGLTILPSSAKLENILNQINILEKEIGEIKLKEPQEKDKEKMKNDNEEDIKENKELNEESDGDDQEANEELNWNHAKDRIEKLINIIKKNKTK